MVPPHHRQGENLRWLRWHTERSWKRWSEWWKKIFPSDRIQNTVHSSPLCISVTGFTNKKYNWGVCVCCGTLLLSKSLKMLIPPSDLFCKEAAAYHMAANPSKRTMSTFSFPELFPVDPHCWQVKSYRLLFFFPTWYSIWENIWGNPVSIPCTID